MFKIFKGKEKTPEEIENEVIGEKNTIESNVRLIGEFLVAHGMNSMDSILEKDSALKLFRSFKENGTRISRKVESIISTKKEDRINTWNKIKSLLEKAHSYGYSSKAIERSLEKLGEGEEKDSPGKRVQILKEVIEAVGNIKTFKRIILESEQLKEYEKERDLCEKLTEKIISLARTRPCEMDDQMKNQLKDYYLHNLKASGRLLQAAGKLIVLVDGQTIEHDYNWSVDTVIDNLDNKNTQIRTIVKHAKSHLNELTPLLKQLNSFGTIIENISKNAEMSLGDIGTEAAEERSRIVIPRSDAIN